MQTPTAIVRLRITSRPIQRCLKLGFPRRMWSTSSTSTPPFHLDLISIDKHLENFLSTLSALQSRLVRFHQSRMRSGVAQVGIQTVTHTRDKQMHPFSLAFDSRSTSRFSSDLQPHRPIVLDATLARYRHRSLLSGVFFT
ncbi:hypothetical protein CDEST_09978 [Colletotrichum destructivum]|uniref:Uncharacterized protein n=1 Tax=Colletotrichum destructivum TaxID=34406 RepID=A0AAX4INS2_9PEZI|nr:hypothetical protein CDEST_09978 [Colletotrichum destructivum]